MLIVVFPPLLLELYIYIYLLRIPYYVAPLHFLNLSPHRDCRAAIGVFWSPRSWQGGEKNEDEKEEEKDEKEEEDDKEKEDKEEEEKMRDGKKEKKNNKDNSHTWYSYS